MRTDILRWGGLFSLLAAAFFAAALALGFTMGVDIYTDDETAQMLTDIDDNLALFIAWALLGMVAPLFLFPAVLGYFYTIGEDDRPYFALVAAFFGLAAVLRIVGHGMAVVLGDVASNYVDETGIANETLIQNGDILQSMLLLLGGISETPFALGLIGVGVLSLRSGFFPRWLAWPAIIVGVVGLAPFVGFIAIVPGRILWLLISGIVMLRRSRAAELRAATAQSAAPQPA